MEGVALACPRCDRRFSPGDRNTCPHHGGERPTLSVVYDVDILRERYDPEQTSRCDIWRYRPLLPVAGTEPVTLGEGWTDLVAADRLGSELGIDLSLKLEGANPSGSSKDRGSAVVATHARERGEGTIACASTGNAAASIAAYAACGDLSCSLFVPDPLPETKAIQPRIYGADVTTVAGTYADAFERCHRAVEENGWLDRSAGATPYAPAGARTLGFELAEQTAGFVPESLPAGHGGGVSSGNNGVPDWVVVPMGNGGIIEGVWKGLNTFERLGYVERTPRLLGVQATNASVIHDVFHGEATGGDEHLPGTCADSIDVDSPRYLREACEALQASGGTSVTVTEQAIRASIERLGRTTGVFAEPASAAGIAGIESARERGIVDASDSVVAVITGTGLKDVSWLE